MFYYWFPKSLFGGYWTQSYKLDLDFHMAGSSTAKEQRQELKRREVRNEKMDPTQNHKALGLLVLVGRCYMQLYNGHFMICDPRPLFCSLCFHIICPQAKAISTTMSIIWDQQPHGVKEC